MRLSTVKLLSLLGLAIGVGVVQIRTGVAAHGGSGGGDSVVKRAMNPSQRILGRFLRVRYVRSGRNFDMVLKGSQSDLRAQNVQLS